MSSAVATQGLPLGEGVGIVTHHSGWTQATFGEVPEKTLVPSAPVIDSMAAPDQTAGILVLSITLPTTDTGGNALAQSEIVKIRMHHSTSSGVDTGDSYVDFPPGVTIQWGPGDVVAHYAAIRVQDTHDHWSVLSNEKSATANAGTEPEYDGLWAHRLGKDSVWTEDSPTTDDVAWSNVTLYWKDNKYAITDGNTNKTYIWWDHSSTTTFQTSDTKPTLTFEDILVATTDAGMLYLTMYSPMVLADFIRAGVLESTNWTTTAGSYFDLDAGTIKLGGSDDPSFAVDAAGLITAKAGTVGGWTLAATTLTGGDLTLDSGNTKIIAGTGDDIVIIDAADADYRLVIGDAVYADAPFSVQKDGKFYLGGVAGNLQWTPSPAALIVTAIYASAATSVERITIATADLKAVDASNNTRANFSSTDITLYDATPTLIAFIPTTSGVTHATNPFFVHAQVTVDNKLVVGSSAIDNPSQALHVTGTGLFTSTVVVGDHGESTTPSVVNVLFYTAGNIPTASTTPRGTFAVQVPA